MSDKPNCSTCPEWKGQYDVPFCKYWDTKIPITKYGLDLISHIGCLSHPQAREYLMREVIAELEETIKCNSRWEKPEPYYLGVNAGCKEAIALIQDGVKKP